MASTGAILRLMATNMRISIPEDLGRAVESAARSEGKTIDQVAIEALQRDLARRELTRLKREADIRRGNMTEEEVERSVDRAISEIRKS